MPAIVHFLNREVDVILLHKRIPTGLSHFIDCRFIDFHRLSSCWSAPNNQLLS
jgi:hypothetical protein